MYYYHVCPVGTIAGKEDLLTYHHNEQLLIGAIVTIPFGRQTKLGVVIQQTTKPSFTTKPIASVLEEAVPKHLIELALWIAEFYATRLALVLSMIVPKGAGKKRRVKDFTHKNITRDATKHALTSEQSEVIRAIKESGAITHLLHGVTGSGKTRVYQELATETLQNHKSVLILVPEISLTPQLAAEFESIHHNVVVLHSGLGESERHQLWQQLSTETEPWVIVGPRSSLFVPISSIGLIVIDECHEPSYQQDSQPKYSALRVARRLAELTGETKLVLASATPLIADYYIAQQTNTAIHTMNTSTIPKKTVVEIVDIKQKDAFGTHPLFSRKLLDAMNKSIAQNEQILLFHNRRGTARMSLCSNCGWIAECPNCHIPLRLHHDHGELRCHVCSKTMSLPQVCPVCKNPSIDFKGFGSKRIEAEIKKLFPSASIARFDSDTPVKEQLRYRYQELYDGTIDIIIGTQGIAKGLDLPNLNTVGIVHADSELFIPDYSSTERSFQLTTQVIGRAGRSGSASQVIIQTLNPEHPAIVHAKNQDYKAFYEFEITERKAEHMPPHTYLLQLTVGYAIAASAKNAAQKLADQIKNTHPDILVRGPAPAFHEHRGTQFYQQLVISSSRRSMLVAIAQNLPQRWQFMLDPINLL